MTDHVPTPDQTAAPVALEGVAAPAPALPENASAPASAADTPRSGGASNRGGRGGRGWGRKPGGGTAPASGDNAATADAREEVAGLVAHGPVAVEQRRCQVVAGLSARGPDAKQAPGATATCIAKVGAELQALTLSPRHI